MSRIPMAPKGTRWLGSTRLSPAPSQTRDATRSSRCFSMTQHAFHWSGPVCIRFFAVYRPSNARIPPNGSPFYRRPREIWPEKLCMSRASSTKHFTLRITKLICQSLPVKVSQSWNSLWLLISSGKQLWSFSCLFQWSFVQKTPSLWTSSMDLTVGLTPTGA
jgi:hypothetical protein